MDHEYLARAVELARLARDHGNHPFGALVVTAAGQVITAENTVVMTGDPTGHAETNLVRLASAELSQEQLATSTLYTSTEPCAMCSGAIFWAGIGTVVFALGGDALIAMLPDSDGFRLGLPSRSVFGSGGKPTTVRGPIDVPGAAGVHDGFWS